MKIPLLCSTCRHCFVMKRGRDVDYNAPPKSRETVVRCRSVGTPHKVKKHGNCNWYERDRIPEQEILDCSEELIVNAEQDDDEEALE